MEKNSENKAKFFAQYMFQHVLMWHDQSILYAVDGSDVATVSTKKTNYFLLLKPLSLITDKDAIGIAKIIGWDKLKPSFADGHPLDLKVSIRDFNWLKNPLCDKTKLGIEAADYLRSKGYALPWMGLSVETLIEYGWIKLKEANNG